MGQENSVAALLQPQGDVRMLPSILFNQHSSCPPHAPLNIMGLFAWELAFPPQRTITPSSPWPAARPSPSLQVDHTPVPGRLISHLSPCCRSITPPLSTHYSIIPTCASITAAHRETLGVRTRNISLRAITSTPLLLLLLLPFKHTGNRCFINREE